MWGKYEKEFKRKLWKLMEDYGFWYPRKMKWWDKEKADEFFRKMLQLVHESKLRP